MTRGNRTAAPIATIHAANTGGISMSRMNEQARVAIVALSSALVVFGVAPSWAAEVRYDPGDTVYYTYCHAHPPALRIKPGDTVITRTKDAANDVFQPTDKTVFPNSTLPRSTRRPGHSSSRAPSPVIRWSCVSTRSPSTETGAGELRSPTSEHWRRNTRRR